MIARTPGWRGRLDRWFDAVRARPFDEAEHNCGLGLAAGAVEAMTGVDPAAELRGPKTIAGQVRRVKRLGFETIGAYAGSLFEPIHPSRAVVGDLVLFADDSPLGEAFGVCNGAVSAVIQPGASGLGWLPTLSARQAYRVP